MVRATLGALVILSLLSVTGGRVTGAEHSPRQWVDLELEVLDPEGRPVKGAWVSVRSSEHMYSSRRSNEKGRVVVRRLRPGDRLEGSIWHPGFDYKVSIDVEVPRSASLLTFRFGPQPRRRVNLEGQLVDASGEPIPEAELLLFEPTVHAGERRRVTNAQGRFRYDGIMEGAWAISMDAPGRPEEVFPLLLRPPVSPVLLVATEPAVVRGRVVGLPRGVHPDVVYIPPGSHLCTHGANGLQPMGIFVGIHGNRFRVRLPAGEWDVEAVAKRGDGGRGNEWRALGRVHVESGGRARLRLRARPVASFAEPCGGFFRPLSVRTLDEVTGEPIADVLVRDQAMDYGYDKYKTDASGLVALDALDLPSGALSVEPPDGWSRAKGEAPSEERDTVELRLHRSSPWSVRVLGPDGAATRWARLALEDDSPLTYTGYVDGDDPLLDDAPAGRFRLELSTEHGRYAYPEPVEIPGPELVVQVPAAGDLDLRVPELEIEYVEGSWLKGVEVRLEPLDGQAEEALVFAETLRLEDVPPGRYRVEVSAPDGRVWTTEAEVRDATTRTALAW